MASEAPEQVIALVVIVSVPEVDHLNAALIVKGVHRIQPLSKAARWHGNFHNKWKVSGDGLAAGSAFVTAGPLCRRLFHQPQTQTTRTIKKRRPNSLFFRPKKNVLDCTTIRTPMNQKMIKNTMPLKITNSL